MALVEFKRGLQADLPTVGEDGVFYLASDSNRLYAGIGENNAPQLLNQTVQIVDNVDNLPTSANVNDFYYCTAENILAVYTSEEKGWIQINPDSNSYVNSAKFEGGVNEEKDAIEYTLTLGYNEETKEAITASLVIDGILLGTIVPSDVSVGIDATAVEGGAKISTVGTGAEGDYTASIIGGTDIVVSIDDADTKNEIKVAHKTYNNPTIHEKIGNALEFNKESFVIPEDIKIENGHIIGYTKTAYVLPPLPTDVYNKDEVDELINNSLASLNPMSYKGVVNSDSDLALKTPGVGDTYMVATAGTYDGVEAKVGDLFIATIAEGAAEVEGVIPADSIVWTYVPAGDESDTDTQYSLTVWADGSVNLYNKTTKKEESTVMFTSDTLQVYKDSENDNAVKINLAWGTF